MIEHADYILYGHSIKRAYMGETPPHFLYGSRFVHLLSGMIPLDTGPDKGTSGTDFVPKLAQLFHFSGAVNLAKALDNPVKSGFSPGGTSAEKLRETVLSRQNDLVRFIAKSFVTASAGREDRLPGPESLHQHLTLNGVFTPGSKNQSNPYPTVYEPYRKFYISRQRLIEARVQRLRADIRDGIAELTPALAGLARIDQALADSLASAPRDILASVPNLLAQRFYRLIDDHWHELPENPAPEDLKPWMASGGWIDTFCTEMREVMFAELDIRLQPVFGMIEALPQQADTPPQEAAQRSDPGRPCSRAPGHSGAR